MNSIKVSNAYFLHCWESLLLQNTGRKIVHRSCIDIRKMRDEECHPCTKRMVKKRFKVAWFKAAIGVHDTIENKQTMNKLKKKTPNKTTENTETQMDYFSFTSKDLRWGKWSKRFLIASSYNTITWKHSLKLTSVTFKRSYFNPVYN